MKRNHSGALARVEVFVFFDGGAFVVARTDGRTDTIRGSGDGGVRAGRWRQAESLKHLKR